MATQNIFSNAWVSAFGTPFHQGTVLPPSGTYTATLTATTSEALVAYDPVNQQYVLVSSAPPEEPWVDPHRLPERQKRSMELPW